MCSHQLNEQRFLHHLLIKIINAILRDEQNRALWKKTFRKYIVWFMYRLHFIQKQKRNDVIITDITEQIRLVEYLYL